MIKVVAPNLALDVLDRAVQVHGGGGVCEDFGPRRVLGVRPHAAAGRRPRTTCTRPRLPSWSSASRRRPGSMTGRGPDCLRDWNLVLPVIAGLDPAILQDGNEMRGSSRA